MSWGTIRSKHACPAAPAIIAEESRSEVNSGGVDVYIYVSVGLASSGLAICLLASVVVCVVKLRRRIRRTRRENQSVNSCDAPGDYEGLVANSAPSTFIPLPSYPQPVSSFVGNYPQQYLTPGYTEV
jgi:hypothetical protein